MIFVHDMRRAYIYPHRSVRSFPLSRRRLLTAVVMASFLSATVVYFGSSLLAAHNRFSWFILDLTRIPSGGLRLLEVFPFLGTATAPAIPVPHHRTNTLRTGISFAACVMALIVIHRRVPLGRNFIVFLLILMCAAGAVIVFNPSFYFDSTMFELIWLRGEILVWIILPWVSALLFVLTLPSAATGVAWALLVQIYAVAWSAVRLAFCLGVLHFTGILFLPLLWFCLGLLFDLVYILVFYSLALHFSIKRTGGLRKS